MKKTEFKRKTETIDKLEKTILDLLETNSLSEIKTRKICEIANVNHQTFYNMYYDQYDLYSELETKAINECLAIIESGFNKSNPSSYIEMIKDTKYFFRLLKQKNSADFKNTIINFIYPILEKEMKVMSREGDKKYLTLYVLNGSLSILEEWIKKDYKENSEYIASIIYKIASSIDIYH